jgi:hypothetical protein
LGGSVEANTKQKLKGAALDKFLLRRQERRGPDKERYLGRIFPGETPNRRLNARTKALSEA